MRISKKLICTLSAVMLLLMVYAAPALAHSAVVTEKGGTVLQFGFSDGSAMPGAKIIVADADGQTIDTSKTDSDGLYDYAEYIDTAATIKVNDGEGHMCTYTVPETIPAATDSAGETPAPVQHSDSQGIPSSAIIGVAIIAVIAVIVVAIMIKNKKRGK